MNTTKISRPSFVVVDWRPFDLPYVYGMYWTEEEADRKAREIFEVDTDDIELPDGIIVRELIREV